MSINKQHSYLQKKVRRFLKYNLGESSFNKITFFQKILGFSKDGSKVIDNLSKLKIEYNFHSTIGNILFDYGYFEEDEIQFFIKKLSGDSEIFILDVGANIGLHSIKWAQALQNVKIFAFEPAIETQRVLERNIARNFLDNKVFIVPKAVSDKPGYAKFFCTEDDAYNSLKNTERKTIFNTIEVPITTIDEFIKTRKINKVSLIKIDVEGFETEVISGATNTLERFKPELFVEIYGGSNSNLNPEETIRLVCSLGYQAFVLRDGVAIPFQEHSDFYYNYYFTSKIF